LWAQACLAADADAGGRNVLSRLDALMIVRPLSWTYDDAAGRLGDVLGIAPARAEVSTRVGGETGQWLLHTTAEAIMAGDLDLGLVLGGEPLNTFRARAGGISPTRHLGVAAHETPPWSYAHPDPPPFAYPPTPPGELEHGLDTIARINAVHDVARRAHMGLTPQEYVCAIGQAYAPMSARAAANPYAWNRTARTPEEIVTPTADNFLLSSPYTKYMVPGRLWTAPASAPMTWNSWSCTAASRSSCTPPVTP
jgi:acetyl-CoA C-acetyltransferase